MIELWFDYASNYSYLSVMRIEALAGGVRWQPFLLGPIFKAQGWDNSPFVIYPLKGNYMWRDMERECAKYGLPWKKPSAFPRNSVLAARVGLLGEPWTPEFSRRVMTANFVEDRDIGNTEVVSEILTGLGLDAPAILAAATSDANKAKLRAQTELASKRGIFGAPTFFVGDEMYWGNDRLDDALSAART